MPKLNGYGQAVMGIGDGVVSVDKRPILYRAGAACWLTDDRVLANALEPDGAWAVVLYRFDGEVELVEDPPVGANELAAGGGRWLGWNPWRGMFGSLGHKPSAGVIAAGRDGTLAYCRDRDVGRGFVLNGPDGRELDVGGVYVFDMHVLSPTSALWYDGRGIDAVGRRLPRFACPPGRTRLATVAGEDWLVYWSEGVGLIAQIDGETSGYVLETRPLAFNHDAVAVGGELIVAWSTTQGEGPNDLVVRLIARDKPRVPLGVPPSIPIPPPIPIPVPKPEPKPMPQTPSLDTWIHTELPQLIAAYRATHPDFLPGQPDAEFGAFQTYRRYVEFWPFPKMLAHEQAQGTGQPSPSEPPQ